MRLQVDEFHSYCRPCLNPQLSSFCIKLTGIQQVVGRCPMYTQYHCCYYMFSLYFVSQSQVDNAPTFTEVFDRFSDWMKERELGTKYHFSLVTDWYVIIKIINNHCSFLARGISGIVYFHNVLLLIKYFQVMLQSGLMFVNCLVVFIKQIAAIFLICSLNLAWNLKVVNTVAWMTLVTLSEF